MRLHRSALVAATLALLPGTALAHHAMGGALPQSAWEGIVSGLAHPVIGLDHLAFLLAGGLLAAMLPGWAGFAALAAFLGAGVVGALLHLAGTGMGPVEAVVALSVLGAGAALLLAPGRLPALSLWLVPGFALAGLFHGHAYAEAVAGSPFGTVLAYLLTLLLSQAAIAGVAMAVALRLTLPALARGLAGGGAVIIGSAALAVALLA
ncbi:HupE/UreJ family protein [Siccirubricoccus sp. KC 17139]|uniref:HupE/UreJ family protein n=1 Tax=Siccirubricoccus soli TaxID=2899147 RepID=A0ABT1DAF8_9PROT|nr:HupE/UreJ family protein [Siccirubricoccus soli]MCO6418908.1 HupE/UreJ family protein [Siccirubricoccus soli]MCP2685043.1 HupE/UreJ family protein [Siccirubricoccus soli]